MRKRRRGVPGNRRPPQAEIRGALGRRFTDRDADTKSSSRRRRRNESKRRRRRHRGDGGSNRARASGAGEREADRSRVGATQSAVGGDEVETVRAFRRGGVALGVDERVRRDWEVYQRGRGGVSGND